MVSKSRRRREARERQQAQGSQPKPTPAAQRAPRRRQPRKRPTMPTGAMARMSIGNRGLLPGQITITHTEMVQTVTTKKSGNDPAKVSMSFRLRPSEFKFAANLSKCFQRFKFDKLSVKYVAGVGTNKSGMVSMGVDWDITQAAKDRTQIAALTPNMSEPVHLSGRGAAIMPIPITRLRGRPWYQISKEDQDGTPASLHVAAVSGTEEMTVGEIWIMYTITFDGTQS